MATKDGIKTLEKKLSDKIDGVDSKVARIDRRLDTEAIQRSDQKIPNVSPILK